MGVVAYNPSSVGDGERRMRNSDLSLAAYQDHPRLYEPLPEDVAVDPGGS